MRDTAQKTKRYDIGAGTLGNGLVVWNSAEERHNDYVTLAHIRHDRSIHYRETVPTEVRTKIEHMAFTDTPVKTGTQWGVFSTPPLGQDVFDQHTDGNHAHCRRPECNDRYTLSVAHDAARKHLTARIWARFPTVTIPVEQHDASGVRITVVTPAREDSPGTTIGLLLTATNEGRAYTVQAQEPGRRTATRDVETLKDAVDEALLMFNYRNWSGILL